MRETWKALFRLKYYVKGLRDQVLALQWIENNIHLFGGDNGKVDMSQWQDKLLCPHLNTENTSRWPLEERVQGAGPSYITWYLRSPADSSGKNGLRWGFTFILLSRAVIGQSGTTISGLADRFMTRSSIKSKLIWVLITWAEGNKLTNS